LFDFYTGKSGLYNDWRNWNSDYGLENLYRDRMSLIWDTVYYEGGT